MTFAPDAIDVGALDDVAKPRSLGYSLLRSRSIGGSPPMLVPRTKISLQHVVKFDLVLCHNSFGGTVSRVGLALYF